jgi:hypothetical protein
MIKSVRAVFTLLFYILLISACKSAQKEQSPLVSPSPTVLLSATNIPTTLLDSSSNSPTFRLTQQVEDKVRQTLLSDVCASWRARGDVTGEKGADCLETYRHALRDTVGPVLASADARGIGLEELAAIITQVTAGVGWKASTRLTEGANGVLAYWSLHVQGVRGRPYDIEDLYVFALDGSVWDLGPYNHIEQVQQIPTGWIVAAGSVEWESGGANEVWQIQRAEDQWVRDALIKGALGSKVSFEDGYRRMQIRYNTIVSDTPPCRFGSEIAFDHALYTDGKRDYAWRDGEYVLINDSYTTRVYVGGSTNLLGNWRNYCEDK